MTFKHKLSVRLALMRDGLLAVPLVVAACATRNAGPTDPAVTLASLFVTPETLTVDGQQQIKFLSYGRTSGGDSVAVASEWSATGGTITSAGLYTSDTTTGDYVVTASVPQVSLSASSRVKVRHHSGTLAQLVLTPSSALLGPGGSQQFAAYGRSSLGDSMAASVSYGATGGSISPNGLYVAGQVGGIY